MTCASATLLFFVVLAMTVSAWVQRSGGRMTFPQIFVGDTHIGGCDDMMALERAGKLDPLLQQAA